MNEHKGDHNMKLYLAPLEGITGHIYRNAHAAFFTPLDKYYTPFVASNISGKFSSREWSDVNPEHNKGLVVVPQVLGNQVEEFLATVRSLAALGYEEVNLNLGCPSGTVVSKYRGSGFLAKPEALDRFLDQVFAQSPVKLSIKTRIGKDEPEEFANIIRIYNQYPIEELTIHPRVQKDYYKNKPRMQVFCEALRESKNPVCYNGDIFTVDHYHSLVKKCPALERVMLGRGVIANPKLGMQIIDNELELSKEQLRAFHDRLFVDYQGVLSGERNVLFKMKEAWFYMSHLFSNHEKYVKKIRKSQHFKDYELAVTQLFEEQQIIKGAGLFTLPANQCLGKNE